jgi:hypothetical protein
MKAIIIQDHDARALLDQLELQTMDARGCDYSTIEMEVRKILESKLPPLEKTAMVEVAGAVASLLTSPTGAVVKEVHRRFHYVICRWLQEQGASVVRY